MRILVLLLISQVAMSQTLITSEGDYIDVPPGKRAVFIKDTLPTEHCIVTCIAPVVEPEPKEPEECCEEGELCFSPSEPCDTD